MLLKVLVIIRRVDTAISDSKISIKLIELISINPAI
jgi:hypothetical protein